MPSLGPLFRSWRSNWGPLVFVWGMWAALAWLTVQFVQEFGVDFPYYDEWELIPTLVGDQPITLKWLWSQHNEHRIFLPRLLYLGVERLARYDFRGGMYFDALALIASAVALIAVARRMRGRTEYTDAFFPLLMLNLGQAQNLANSFQVAFIAGTLLMVAVIALSVRAPKLGYRSSVALGVCTVLLPLVGGHGVALVPALSASVVISGWGLRGEPGGRWRTLVVWALAGLGIALTAYYFVGYARPPRHAIYAAPGLEATLDGAIQFLTTGFGAAAKLGWPKSRWVFLIACGASLAALVSVFWNRPEEHGRATRLLFFLTGLVSLALGTGWARTTVAPGAMFASRYASLAAPFWFAIYFVWELVGQAKIRLFVQTTLLFLAAALAVPNGEDAAREGATYRDNRQRVIADLRAGMPVEKVVSRHSWRMYYGDRRLLIRRLQSLRAKNIGVFKHDE